MSLTRTNLSYVIAFITLLIISFFLLFTFGQIVHAHGDEGEEEASENLVEIVIAPGENYHIEIEAETLDGKRIPELGISVVAINVETGEEIEKTLHGMFGGNYHYGSNMALPEGEYSFAFHIDPPTFMREGSKAGSWAMPIDAEYTFSTVDNPDDEFETVIKTTGDMKIIFVAEPAQAMWVLPEVMEEMMEHMEGTTGASDGMSKTLLAVLALIVGGGLGFFFGRSRKQV